MSISESCVEESRNRYIVCQENRKKITFVNSDMSEIKKVTVDGCAITDGIRCDFLVIKDDLENYVELKGKDIKHAADQISRTINILSKNPKSMRKFSFIISSRVPLTPAVLQNLKLKFKNRFNSELVIRNNSHRQVI